MFFCSFFWRLFALWWRWCWCCLRLTFDNLPDTIESTPCLLFSTTRIKGHPHPSGRFLRTDLVIFLRFQSHASVASLVERRPQTKQHACHLSPTVLTTGPSAHLFRPTCRLLPTCWTLHRESVEEMSLFRETMFFHNTDTLSRALSNKTLPGVLQRVRAHGPPQPAQLRGRLGGVRAGVQSGGGHGGHGFH